MASEFKTSYFFILEDDTTIWYLLSGKLLFSHSVNFEL